MTKWLMPMGAIGLVCMGTLLGFRCPACRRPSLADVDLLGQRRAGRLL
jgi:hypothetical protein